MLDLMNDLDEIELALESFYKVVTIYFKVQQAAVVRCSQLSVTSVETQTSHCINMSAHRFVNMFDKKN